MRADWISTEQIARDLGLTLSEAQALADRLRWPKVFRLHETLVLAPRPLPRR